MTVAACVFTRDAGAEEPARYFEYLYIESNSGDSSGGHAAICFAKRCYHFQQDQEQTIRLHESAAAEFDYRYRLLGNRTIHASRIEVSTSTYGGLQGAFKARLRVQDQQYELLESLVRDRQLLRYLLGQSDSSPVRLPGSGYFYADQDGPRRASPATRRSGVLDELAARLRTAYGDGFLERRAVELRAAIAGLTPPTTGSTFALPEAGVLPLVSAGFATRYRELVSGWLAITVLHAALPLRPGSFQAPQSGEFGLAPAEIDVLREYAKQLTRSLVRLAASKRPDWGYPMLVGMARLVALDASIRSGRLIQLDTFSEDAPQVSAATVSRHERTLAVVRDERRNDFLAVRRALFAADPPTEMYISALETSGTLFLDADHALKRDSPMRVYSGSTVPMKAAVRRDWPLPQVSRALLERALAVAYAREGAYRAALARLYPYELFSRNCVTEIFRVVDTAMAAADPVGLSDPATVRETSRIRLGGYVEWRHTLNFIPFVSDKAVGATYRVSSRVERPSYRRMELDQMYRHENAVRVDLRESNVLTAHSYERNKDDPIFLFFTDDVVLRRPLYGVVNLAAGIGGTLAGLVLWPIDGGTTLRAGLNGTIFSVPEMAFLNIRKGSFLFVPRRWLDKAAED